MVARLMLHPFAITVSGRVATAQQGSDAYIDSQLRVVIGTHLGERDMCVPYGVPDPTFAQLSAADIQTCVDRFGPDDCVITDLQQVGTSDLTDRVTLTWQRRAL